MFLYLGWVAKERGEYEKAIEYLTNAVKLNPYDKSNREKYMAMLQNKYKICRFVNWPAKLLAWQALLIWIVGWLFFKPLIIIFIVLYVISHWTTKLIIHVKIFGWNFRRA